MPAVEKGNYSIVNAEDKDHWLTNFYLKNIAIVLYDEKQKKAGLGIEIDPNDFKKFIEEFVNKGQESKEFNIIFKLVNLHPIYARDSFKNPHSPQLRYIKSIKEELCSICEIEYSDKLYHNSFKIEGKYTLNCEINYEKLQSIEVNPKKSFPYIIKDLETMKAMGRDTHEKYIKPLIELRNRLPLNKKEIEEIQKSEEELRKTFSLEPTKAESSWQGKHPSKKRKIDDNIELAAEQCVQIINNFENPKDRALVIKRAAEIMEKNLLNPTPMVK